jgi:hypothetical protein
MHHGETAYYIADSWFVDRARELASASQHSSTCRSPATWRLRCRPVLAADARQPGSARGHDAVRVAICGIDRWLGGVHVQGHGRAWRWSARSGHLVEA